jgi:hypothetical protein
VFEARRSIIISTAIIFPLPGGEREPSAIGREAGEGERTAKNSAMSDPPHPTCSLRSQVDLSPPGRGEDDTLHHVREKLPSLPLMPIADIGRGAMIAGQKLEKLFAFFASATPGGDCAKHGTKGLDAARAQRSQQRSRAQERR